MKAPSTEMQNNVKSSINWNIVWYFGSLALSLFFASCLILNLFNVHLFYGLYDNLIITTLFLMLAYLHKPIKIPDGMERVEAETFVAKKINRKQFFRYTYYYTLFAICSLILIVDFFDLGSLI